MNLFSKKITATGLIIVMVFYWLQLIAVMTSYGKENDGGDCKEVITE